jgi:hypothetical protein
MRAACPGDARCFYSILDSLQCRKVLGHLFLLGSELLYGAPHDVEI